MKKPEILQHMLSYIERTLGGGQGDSLTLDDIAEKIGYSKYYLNRIFRAHTGLTIHQYIVERRLTEAARELVYSQKPLIDIAYEAGYHSQQAFTNAFSNVYRCSPRDYRAARTWFPLRAPLSVSKLVVRGTRVEARAAA